jgi:glycosyltransferase involved in cell wall biosynthesis
MAEGLPVLAAPVGGIVELFDPGVEGEVWGLQDARAAARVLIELTSDPERLAGMAARARDRVEQEFATGVVGPRLESFLVEQASGVRSR